MNVDDQHFLVESRYRQGAGNALFATADVPPSRALFTLPARAKMNIVTLSPRYPSSARAPILTATQLISLHLLLSRPSEGDESPDPIFRPYISVLPQEFDSHPLTWLVKRRLEGSSPAENSLLSFLPPSACSMLFRIETRFLEDWRIVREYILDFRQELPIEYAAWEQLSRDDLERSSTLNFLWAWLNVNTRCLYDDLGKSRGDNLSMCPVFDLANHAWQNPTMEPKNRNEGFGRRMSDLTCTSGKTAIAKGEELCITYGAHSNCFLFAEYGFINNVSEEAISTGVYPGEVNVQDIVEELFAKRGQLGAEMKGILEAESYWGDWTLHSSPRPAYPSYRLITALRLYHICPDVPDHGVLSDSSVQIWRSTVYGQTDVISGVNEAAWRKTLLQICRGIEERAQSSVERIDSQQAVTGEASEAWLGWALDNVRRLWMEEMLVSREVARSVEAGEEF
ncbi:SET domain-containing protein [Dentipellis sp. KUC8613]|nr:SET domain-containing protein [Dentipellis sp. KUC8613]